jgi:hypothetical protein
VVDVVAGLEVDEVVVEGCSSGGAAVARRTVVTVALIVVDVVLAAVSATSGADDTLGEAVPGPGPSQR